MPEAALVRADLLSTIKERVLAGLEVRGGGGAEESATKSSGSAPAQRGGGALRLPTKIVVHGMGGVGKTILLAMFLRETPELGRSFHRICWIAFGQEPNLPELQKSLYRQLTGGEELVGVPEGPKREEAALRKLQEAAKGQRVLVVLDDAWEATL